MNRIALALLMAMPMPLAAENAKLEFGLLYMMREPGENANLLRDGFGLPHLDSDTVGKMQGAGLSLEYRAEHGGLKTKGRLLFAAPSASATVNDPWPGGTGGIGVAETSGTSYGIFGPFEFDAETERKAGMVSLEYGAGIKQFGATDVYLGLRFLASKDEVSHSFTAPAFPGTGNDLSLDASSYIFGPQIGFETQFGGGSSGFVVKLSGNVGYGVNQSKFSYDGAGYGILAASAVSQSVSERSGSGFADLGISAAKAIGRGKLSIGYSLLWMSNIASSPLSSSNSSITQGNQTAVLMYDNVLYHGLKFGYEMSF